MTALEYLQIISYILTPEWYWVISGCGIYTIAPALEGFGILQGLPSAC